MIQENRRAAAIVAALLLAAGIASAAEATRDSDGDGIWDAHEETLGTDPNAPEPFHPVSADGLESDARRRDKTYDATKDFTAVEFCHVAENRYVWRATFAAEPRLEDTVFHLYVDADANPETGRKAAKGSTVTGTDYMVTVAAGRGYCGHYSAEGEHSSGPRVTYAVQGKTLYVCADLELGHDEKGVRYALYVLCHTVTGAGRPVAMSDSTGKALISGIPPSKRKKIVRPGDQEENLHVEATFGLDLLRAVLRSPDTVVVPHDKLRLEGFEVDLFTSRRWPHVRRVGHPGKVWAAAPKAGRYHLGFMMYDDSQDERVAIYAGGKLCGVAVARQDNNRTWLYWLQEAREFSEGQRVELRAVGPGGKHGICNVLFLPRPPEVRRIEYRVENLVAAAQVGQPGRVTVSWTTSWPCPTRFEYGLDTRYGKTVESDGSCLVHRVVLEGLDPTAVYHGRAIGTARDGSRFLGPDFTFRAAPPVPPETRAGTQTVPLAIRNPHGFPVQGWPVTTGVPFPQGELGNLKHVRLVDDKGEVPGQVRLLARWPDGSVKWALLTFLASAPAEAEAQYRLEFGAKVHPGPVPKGISVARDTAGIKVNTGPLGFRVDPHGNLTEIQRDGKPVSGSAAPCASLVTVAGGKTYDTTGSPAELTVEESGPLRAVVKTVSRVADGDGRELLRVEKQIEAYRGTAMLRIHHTFVVTGEEKFTDLGELSWRVPVPGAAGAWQVPLESGDPVVLDSAHPVVRQPFDNELMTAAGDGDKTREGRAIGAIIAGGPDGCAVAVRDLWQNYPKGFSLRPDGLHVELCPPLETGPYDKFPFEKEGHHLYYYLLGGRYRLKKGVAKTHELLLCFEPEPRRTQSCKVFERPLLATAPPEWCCGTKVFYDLAPRDAEKFRLYEEAIDKNLKAYVAGRERQHDYGMLNYGDWYGERGTNWGNIEYDTQHAFFLEYVRSGNPAAFFLGETTELHNRDVDTVQWSPNPYDVGAVYVHQMCHVGDYYDKGVPGSLGFPRGGFTVTHAWVEGHFAHYFLTGDRRSYETGCAVADFFTRKQLGRPYDFSTCRTPGWHLIMLAAAHAATGDPYYLNASKVVVERVLQTQDKQPRPLPDYQAAGRQPHQTGGWSRMMVPGHCRCEPRHRGNAGFMVAVLLSGLKYYHDTTGDPRAKECLVQGAHNLLDETYSDQAKGFRYTSCPNTKYGTGTTPLMVEGIARAYLWTKDERFRRVLTEALPRGARGSGYGKGFSMYYRTAPRVLADLDAAGIKLNQLPESGP